MNVLRIHITARMKPIARTWQGDSLVNVKQDTVETDINVQVNRCDYNIISWAYFFAVPALLRQTMRDNELATH